MAISPVNGMNLLQRVAARLFFGANSVFEGANRSLGSASIAQAFKASMTSIRSVMTSTLAGMRVAWSVAWTTMAAVTRAAMIAVKTAIVSTGIGLIIVGIGEALGALYSWFMVNSEAAKQAAESARQFERALGQIEKQAGKVKTQEQYDSFMEELEARIEELREAREMAYQDEDWDKGEQLTEQLDRLWEKKAIYKETLPLQIEEARKAEEAARRMKEQAEAAAELEKKLEAAREKLADMVKKQQEKSREDYLSGIEDTDKQITLRLQDAGGFSSLQELKAAMEELARTPLTQESDVEQYDATSQKPEKDWGCEMVIRSATTSYCALGMFDSISQKSSHIRDIFENACSDIQMWDNDFEMTHKTPLLCACLDAFQSEFLRYQKPLLMQTIWKTKGKNPLLADNAFDIIIWSDYAFSRLFIDSSYTVAKTMSRPMRATARLARCLWELSKSGKIRVSDIYRKMAFGNQTDKEFAIGGQKWRNYVTSDRVISPILPKEIIKEIIEDGFIDRLSPERRFDQTLYFTVRS